jgi:phosphomannomutase
VTFPSAIQELFASFIVPGHHDTSDYFGLINELVKNRSAVDRDNDAHAEFQQAIDAVYDLVLQELLTNRNRPRNPVKFGTSGWRGILGKDLYVRSVGLVTRGIVDMYREVDERRESDPDFIGALGVKSFAEACERGCVVGFDNRFGGPVLAEEVVRVLTAAGIKVHYAGEATTGTLSATLIRLGAAFSINLTPSHNPLQYGGFKYNAADGGPAASILTDRITAIARTIFESSQDEAAAALPSPVRSVITSVNALQLWIDFVKANETQHGLDYENIMDRLAANRNMVVAVDCIHGASRLHMGPFFRGVSRDRLFLLRDTSDPTFGGIAPEPSSGNIQPVMTLLGQRSEPLKLGAIIDPDGDRIRFTDGRSEIGMNQFGAIAFHYLHEVKKKKGLLAKTVATSNFANSIANGLHEEIFETRVGFKEFKPVIGRALVCFEESDGITVKGHTAEKDAYIGLLLALDLMLTTGQNLGDYLLELEKEYGIFYPAAAGIAVSRQGKELQRTLAGLDKYTVGTAVPIDGQMRIINEIIAIDGRKMIFEDGSWLMIRPSGTEPKVRFYVEARSERDKGLLLQAARTMLRDIGLVD